MSDKVEAGGLIIKLKDLFANTEVQLDAVIGKQVIKGIAYDSRLIEKDFVFVAITGLKCDGHQFISDAIKNGASVIVAEQLPDEEYPVPIIVVNNSRRILAQIAANYYDHPSKKLTLIGVTGTNGKTTITYLMESILSAEKYAVGVIGTINYRVGKKVWDAQHTTPESLDLQRILSEMVALHVTHVVMEVSSHALDLDRVYCCHFNVAIFTNLTQDHLDYHRDIDSYFNAKAKLFKLLAESEKPKKAAVVNVDNMYGKKITNIVGDGRVQVVTYALKTDAMFVPQDVSISLKGTLFKIKYGGSLLPIESPLIGEFNVYNVTAAIGASDALKISKAKLQLGISKMTHVPGRMQVIPLNAPFRVIVDYAHTEDALRSVLGTLKKLAPKRVIVVFGCGGDRDRLKRPEMGRVVRAMSDFAVVTSDNPRTEDPRLIIAEIIQPLMNDMRNIIVEADRRKAIQLAVQEADVDDIILIAGKGHEDYQIVGTKKVPFDDIKIVAECYRLSANKGGGKSKKPSEALAERRRKIIEERRKKKEKASYYVVRMSKPAAPKKSAKHSKPAKKKKSVKGKKR